ncbi:MAG: HD domain-containing protein [Candidatus Kapabacteria bacterium]|nr:HD domain-containing protein [Candidatus Kapabacteria bacterium]MCS7169886.1 HD domain-containing protein [Candidatus Kapabacteria bacterium]MDW7996691.1 HD domain-containing protein [Bacteroidota bacterium]MDW8226096.1 HD domain-containing protein [Bacteroidota bacterium]
MASDLPYNLTYLSRQELVERLQGKVDPVELNRILSAYDVAASVHELQLRRDGSPYFYHVTRVCKILLDELGITDPDVLIAALLHDVLEDSEELSAEVLEYNFGARAAAMVQTLTKDLQAHERDPDAVDWEHVERLRRAPAECLLVRLATRLDNFRCLGYDLKRNPLRYIQQTWERYIPLAQQFDDPRLKQLVSLLQRERNKFWG